MSYPDKKKMCHRTGFSKSCRDLLDEGTCQGRWVHITGTDLNNGNPIDVHGCVDDAQYLLQQSFEHRLVGIQSAVETRGDQTHDAISGRLAELSVRVQQLTGVVAKGILMQQGQHEQALRLGGQDEPKALTADDDLPLLAYIEGAKAS